MTCKIIISSTDPNRLNFRPLVVQMPSRHIVKTNTESLARGVEELQTSPQLEIETSLVEQEMTNAEQQLEKGAAIATEESDADTVRVFYLSKIKT